MKIPLPSLIAGVLVSASCAGGSAEDHAAPPEPRIAGSVHLVADTLIDASIDAAGVAEAIARSTLATKLMGVVTAVLVREGDRVAAGQALARIDARDIAARAEQVAASIAEAEAVLQDAEVQAGRIRALYADSAATRAQRDAAETGLARAQAGVRAARAGQQELRAVADYSVVRAPFAGVVIKRFVDPGAFAAPGAPLIAVQDDSRLRISVSAAPDAVRGLRRGDAVQATIEGTPVPAIIEGVVPAMAGNLYTVNAIVPNAGRAYLAGSAATIALPLGTRRVLVVPSAAVVREGDLTGVYVRGDTSDELRWIRLGRPAGALVEVTSGLRAGESVVVPARPSTSVAERS